MNQFKLFFIFTILLTSLSFCVSCSSEEEEEWWWETQGGDKGDKDEEGEGNEGGDENENEDSTIVDNSKPRFVWIDAGGNFEDYANDKDAIKRDLAKIKEAGFTEVVVDVRPTTGDVLFTSSVARPVQRMDVWSKVGYIWVERTATWDYLQVFIDEGHALGLKVNASINTFVGGCLCPYGLGSEGLLYSDTSKKSWATVINSENGLINTLDNHDDTGAKFFNPANDEVQEYLLNILADLAKYDIDGIILDRCRYSDDNLMSDFSEETRTKFEQFIGKTINNYPAEIMAPGTSTSIPANVTSTFKSWMDFRVKTIHDFIVKARDKVKSVNQKIRFGAYVGGWYSSYYTSGVNWASPKHNAQRSYYWASSDYSSYGYADHLDFLFIGAYASSDKIYGTTEWTTQGFCKVAGSVLCGDVKYYGGPDIGNSTGWVDGNKGSLIPNVIDACINSSDGFFVFDLCHIKKFNYWSNFKTGFDSYLNSLSK